VLAVLAFDDVSFARLLGAAKRVPRRQRGHWLESVAKQLEGAVTGGVERQSTARRRKADRERQQRRRQRREAGFRVAELDLSPAEQDYLRALNLLQDWSDPKDRKAMGFAVKLLLTQLVAKCS
jgi:hypothetical protein